MSEGYQRRANGEGRRPNDSTVRLRRDTVKSLARLRELSPFYGPMSADTIIADLVDMAIMRIVINRADDNARAAIHQANMPKVYTPSPEQR